MDHQELVALGFSVAQESEHFVLVARDQKGPQWMRVLDVLESFESLGYRFVQADAHWGVKKQTGFHFFPRSEIVRKEIFLLRKPAQ